MFDRLRSEAAYLTGAIRTLRRVTPIARNHSRTWPDVVEDLARQFGDRPALIGQDETLTYAAFHARGNRYARWCHANGVAKGDVVALMMPNRPDYLCAWLGVIRAGGVCALLNTNLTGASLAHCIDIVGAGRVIVATELFGQLEGALPLLRSAPAIWVHGAGQRGQARIDQALAAVSDDPIPAGQRPALTTSDRALYIYTSGTTGLPKAANINHYRIQSVMNGFSAAAGATAEDRIYVCLPMYHTSGGVLAVGITLTVGGSVVIREKFSAREFWDDIVENDCTMFQYIGELCRYLVNSPPHPNERRHKIRLANGNGLRPDIWQEFKDRFGLPRILEWYAATEGNCVLFNFDGKPGAIGRIPKWLEGRFVVKLIGFDLDRDVPLRGPDGLCIECAVDEIGEAVSQITDDPAKPSQRFDGYADPAATESKVLRDAFTPGDAWFRTGDLMRKDARGYFYFVDRIGDTFRWKGENVATSEVSEAITTYPGVREANVYGVRIADRDGRAGMASIVAEPGLDLAALKRHIDARLPTYARPVFLRLAKSIEVTGTFKQRKVELVAEGFNPSGIGDDLYFNDPQAAAYVPLDAEIYARIFAGEVRL